MKIKNKRGELAQQVLIQIILIALIMAMFLMATASKINGRGVRQDILENEIAMLIEAAVPGMSFEVSKLNANGRVDYVKAERGKVFVSVDGLGSLNGRSYFSQYEIKVLEEKNKFVVMIL